MLTKNLQTETLRRHPLGQDMQSVLREALAAVDPYRAVAAALQLDAQGRLRAGGHLWPLADFRQVVVLSVGKAAEAMAQAAFDRLGQFVRRGLVIAKHPSRERLGTWPVLRGGHPVPDENSLRAGERALNLAGSLDERDLFIVLISGGGSALMASPRAGLQLTDLQALTQGLLASGARIDEINVLRRALDEVKGGGLTLAARGAQVLTLLLSDVVGSPLEAIASGPTVANPTDAADALAVLRKYDLMKRVPPNVLQALSAAPRRSMDAETFARVYPVIVADNQRAAQAALSQAAKLGYRPLDLGSSWQGEARRVGADWAARMRAVSGKVCLVAGGETTVTLRGDGLGGRNQEVALAAVRPLAGVSRVLLATLATDGEDGPTDAAGAVVSGDTLGRAQALGLAPEDFLARNDAWHFFNALNDLLRPGPTGTNVNDLAVMLVDK